MMDHVDENATRERLERERARVGELISELRSEGLDEEQASHSGDLTHYYQHLADQASEMFEREKDLAILEALEVAFVPGGALTLVHGVKALVDVIEEAGRDTYRDPAPSQA